jgi:hypothetical protein
MRSSTTPPGAAPPHPAPHVPKAHTIFCGTGGDKQYILVIAYTGSFCPQLLHKSAAEDLIVATAAPTVGTLLGVERGDRQTLASMVHAANWLRMCGDETFG